MPFAGRTLELQALDAALAAAYPRVVVIEAPAAAGKTALVGRWVAGVSRRRVLRVSGEPNERNLPRGVIDQLLGRAGGASVLDALRAEPTVLVLDDAQWADPESIDALVFALRRLVAEPVLTIVCTRPGAPLTGLDRLADTRVRLPPLSQADVRALTDLPDGPARRLWEHTAGLPGHVVALAPSIPADPEEPLPAPPALIAEVGRSLASCPPEVARLAEAAAVLGSGCRLADAAALAGLTEARADTAQADTAQADEARADAARADAAIGADG
ncbi:hypothetical protein OJ998_34395, partial [Solirubrobacter taibaiensis]|nr:hypothetical protein [Solirubrobacter taibaiensis]